MTDLFSETLDVFDTLDVFEALDSPAVVPQISSFKLGYTILNCCRSVT